MLDTLLNGLWPQTFWGYTLVILVFTQITIAAVTVYLHRCQAHRALTLHPILSHFFRFWLWLTTGMSTTGWVATHRKHHAMCETADDPHSPQILGLKKVLFEGAELYRQTANDAAVLERYGVGTPNDWLERHVYTRLGKTGVTIMLFINLILFGVAGIVVWGIQMMWIPFWAAGVINGVGHYWGYRNFECPDAATNISPIGFFIGGEELHNNHHTYPTSAKFSVKPWEFDFGWGYIKVFSWFGLAKVKRVPPKPVLQANKASIDMATVKAIVRHRFQILSHYSRDVIFPVLTEEKRRASDVKRGFLKRAKKLLARETSLIKQDEQQHLEQVLKEHEQLAVVYRLRIKLEQLWRQRAYDSAELLKALQEWCQQAEASSIKSLQQFSKTLRAYA